MKLNLHVFIRLWLRSWSYGTSSERSFGIEDWSCLIYSDCNIKLISGINRCLERRKQWYFTNKLIKLYRFLQNLAKQKSLCVRRPCSFVVGFRSRRVKPRHVSSIWSPVVMGVPQRWHFYSRFPHGSLSMGGFLARHLRFHPHDSRVFAYVRSTKVNVTSVTCNVPALSWLTLDGAKEVRSLASLHWWLGAFFPTTYWRYCCR